MGRFGGPLGPFGGSLGALWGPLGGPWGSFGPLWGPFGCPGGLLGGFLGVFFLKIIMFDVCGRPLGVLGGPSEAFWGLCWTPGSRFCNKNTCFVVAF